MKRITLCISALCLSYMGYAQENTATETVAPDVSRSDTVPNNSQRDPNYVYVAVQVKASPVGSMRDFVQEFTNRFMISQEAIQGLNGMRSFQCILQFVVETDGSFSNIMVARDPGYGLGTEAVRTMSTVNRWTPAIQNNKNVRSRFTLPITIYKTGVPLRWNELADENGYGYMCYTMAECGTESFKQLFREAFMKTKYYVAGREYALRLDLSMDERGELSNIILINLVEEIELSTKELTDMVQSLAKWLPTRVNGIPVKDDVYMLIGIESN